MNKIEIIQSYIEECEKCLNGQDKNRACSLEKEIVNVYCGEINKLTAELDAYNSLYAVKMKNGINVDLDYLKDIKLLKAKLINYQADLELLEKKEINNTKQTLKQNRWTTIKNHPFAIIVSCLIIAIQATYYTIYQLQIVPLNKEIEMLKESIELNYVPKENYLLLLSEKQSLKTLVEKKDNSNKDILQSIEQQEKQKEEYMCKLSEIRKNSSPLTSSPEGPKEVTKEEIEILKEIENLSTNIASLYQCLK